MGKGILRKVTTTLAIIAFLLQVASIASPGWIIYIKGNTEIHHSLFYKQTCKTVIDETKCKFESFHDLHYDLRDRLLQAQVGRKKIAEVDFEYHSLMCQQVLMIVATCLGLTMALSQVIQSIRRHKAYPRLIFLSAATAATSAGLVVAVACNEIVNVYYQMELQNMDDLKDHTYVGFPYCIGMTLGSALLHIFSLLSISSQLHTPKIKIKPRKVYADDETDDVPTTYVKPETTLNEVSAPSPSKSKSTGNDNPVFSEKL